MKKVMFLAVAAVIILTASSASAALSFIDPSFENGGSTDMAGSTNYNEANKWNTTFHGDTDKGDLATDVWHHWLVNNGDKGGLLEDKDSYKGYDVVPAGVTGEQFHTYGRGGAAGVVLQYVKDDSETTGLVTFSIDYWAHELDPANPAGGTGNILFEVFAFNDPTKVFYQNRDEDVIYGQEYITSGGDWVTVDVVDATTGFQTIQATLDLGTGYTYVGVAFGNKDVGKYTDAEGVVVSFDNLVTPEPATMCLLGLGFLLVRRKHA